LVASHLALPSTPASCSHDGRPLRLRTPQRAPWAHVTSRPARMAGQGYRFEPSTPRLRPRLVRFAALTPPSSVPRAGAVTSDRAAFHLCGFGGRGGRPTSIHTTLFSVTVAGGADVSRGMWAGEENGQAHTRHPGGNPGANLKSISHRYYVFEVAFVWELTKEIIDLHLGCCTWVASTGPPGRLWRHLWR